MKELKIRILVKDDKVATAFERNGFNGNSMSDQLELLGIFENLKSLQLERIKKLGEVHKNGV